MQVCMSYYCQLLPVLYIPYTGKFGVGQWANWLNRNPFAFFACQLFFLELILAVHAARLSIFYSPISSD